ncbi:MAG: M20/M25/M40 family metallo-hydrolase [Pyrinomonadaceae bacterium]|nr:M20/M25/M40 family metallo-hydrolase [Pyrinomonadaceae bacterium]
MKMKTTTRLGAYLLIAVFAFAALAQQPAPASGPSVERLHSHIEYLASDKLTGRRTGSPGANLAAEYIAREFSRLGLRPYIGGDLPGMSHRDWPRYLQQFPYVGSVELGKSNLLLVKSERTDDSPPRVGEDWMPLGFSASSKIDGAAVVFAGYGISAPELKYDDYTTTNVKGNVAVVFSGTPDGNTPHGQFARAGEVRFKAAAAQAAGARALIIIAVSQEFKTDRLARLTYDNAGEAGIPVLVVSRQLAEQILSSPQLTDFESVADSRTVTRESEPNLGEGLKFPVTRASLLRLPVSENTISIVTDVVRKRAPGANVIGILDGSDPKLKSEAIVIGAHYDHLGLGGEGSLAPKEGEIHHGADDNASGTAGLLELARLFASEGAKPKRTIVFIAFGGEEEGLLGSNYYVNHPIVPLANTVAMINMDMIGRLKNRNLIIGGMGTAPEWRPMVEAANFLQGMTVTAAGIPTQVSSVSQTRAPIVISANGQTIVTSDASKQFQLTLNEDGFGPSDHSSFYARQIPVLFFWTGTHEDYHKPSDTADKINYEDEVRILSLVARIVRDLDAETKRPTYAAVKSQAAARTGGFSVSLGTIPNYADSNDGLLIDGVRDDSPAARAGIKAGDKIVKLAGRDIRNVYDYTAALGEMRAGHEYDVELMRAGERLKLKIIPAARR